MNILWYVFDAVKSPNQPLPTLSPREILSTKGDVVSVFHAIVSRLLRVAHPAPHFEGDDVLLHVSDTPACVYGFLKRLIESVRPAYIVHTGDLVDDVKLELYPNSLDLYTMRLEKLLHILRGSGASVFLVPGNHDDVGTLERRSGCAVLVESGGSIPVCGRQIRVGHKSEGILAAPERLNLFGHDLSVRSGIVDGKVYLNGLQYMHLVNCRTWEIAEVRYPFGTDDARMLRRRRRV